MKRLLSQQEIDSLFNGMSPSRTDEEQNVAAFDFSRLDRIPKSQVRVVHALFETFVRNLATSLPGYLRTYVSPNLVSLEQISYGEFLESLETPSCIAYVGLRPFDGTMLIGLGRPMVFGAVELLLGGEPTEAAAPARKLTEIEKNLIHNLLRVMLDDFREAWRSVADIDFEVQTLADDPHGLRVLTSAEAIVSVSIEIKIGQMTSMVNMAIPSIFVKRLRDRLDRLQSVQQSASRREDRARMATLLRHSQLDFEVRLDGGMVSSRDVARLAVGEVVMLAHPADRPLGAYLNGHPMFLGSVDASQNRLRYTVSSRLEAE
jgi:flagellar motor switch protein FliM